MKEHYLLTFIDAVFINNFALVKCLGLCPLVNSSKKIETAFGLGSATSFVMMVASILSWCMNKFFILKFNVPYLQTFSCILITAVTVQISEFIIRKIVPDLYKFLGIFLPLITTNCVVLGVILLNINKNYNFFQSIFYSFSASIGFILSLVLFTSMKERLMLSNIPTPFQGSSIFFITIGLMSLSFIGFNGLVKF